MSQPPRDWEEFWIRFVCAFLVFGVLAAFLMFRSLDELGIAAGFEIWAAVTLSISLYAARVGDEAWHRLVRLLCWWGR